MTSRFAVGSTRFYLVLALVAAASTGCARREVAPQTLPIYRLTSGPADESLLRRLASSAFGLSGKPEREGGRLSLRDGSRVVELFPASGGIWAADERQLWNPDLTPKLPDEAGARRLADAFVERSGFLPKLPAEGPAAIAFAAMGKTQAAFYDAATRRRTDRQLDVQVNYATQLAIQRRDSTWHLPVVGGGGEFNVTLGDGASPIGFSGTWRPITGIETEAPLISRAAADSQFRALVRGLDIRRFDAFLAYYSAPPSVEQRFLYPVYVYRAVALIDSHLVPLRMITIPATTWGPHRPPAKPRPARSDGNRPLRRSTMPEGTEERGVDAPKSRGVSSSAAETPFAWGVPAAWAQSSSWKEGGTSWIGLSGGLSGSENNAQGFVDGLSADGWTINFNWGDAAAWESDWRRNDDDWVDAADFVFYTGHASMDGWVLSNPDDGGLDFSEVGSAPACPGDLWGSSDLEWAIIAACGPLQDELLSSGGGDVFDRWDGAFDRLHQLLGYGAITFDNEEEGERVVEYARGGDSVINAWFRAAREIQPSTNGASAPDGPTIWVGVMYVGRSGAHPGSDHIWGHGSVAPDPCTPSYYVAIWTTT